ncbi:hypothetical protein GRB63_05720, partial [Staphylococcus aureus]|nr:hypothetical protein [Staphylococcus aureus]
HHNTATPHHSTTSSRVIVPAHQSNMASTLNRAITP